MSTFEIVHTTYDGVRSADTETTRTGKSTLKGRMKAYFSKHTCSRKGASFWFRRREPSSDEIMKPLIVTASVSRLVVSQNIPEDFEITNFLLEEHEKSARMAKDARLNHAAFLASRPEYQVSMCGSIETELYRPVSGGDSTPLNDCSPLAKSVARKRPKPRRKKGFQQHERASKEKLIPPLPSLEPPTPPFSTISLSTKRSSSRSCSPRAIFRKATPSASRMATYIGASADVLHKKRNSLTSQIFGSASKFVDFQSSATHLPYASDASSSTESFFCVGEDAAPLSKAFELERPTTADLASLRRLSDTQTSPWMIGVERSCKHCKKDTAAGYGGLCRECRKTLEANQSKAQTVTSVSAACNSSAATECHQRPSRKDCLTTPAPSQNPSISSRPAGLRGHTASQTRLSTCSSLQTENLWQFRSHAQEISEGTRSSKTHHKMRCEITTRCHSVDFHGSIDDLKLLAAKEKTSKQAPKSKDIGSVGSCRNTTFYNLYNSVLEEYTGQNQVGVQHRH